MSENLVNLDGIFNLALKETQELIELGYDISDPSFVTSLEWYAGKYPEIAERCNNTLRELIEKQAVMYPELANAYYDIDSHVF
ncbi:hypothetical protein DSM106972_028310 [Dulcicalothrix desertica PCC 7102]|uniref:Uncharacterized protein n=1 Tax=Dulcicalothrix desertica PCC 7102 TaxID=232991 RepID=A0A3S1CNX3_9CYAN|nr:hypothetical protein [Dulcicalothrix desertica]RUT06574.1 hypothetical protein DSM106972_028310 [Dulcicalothrix desertica PCC 7102]TWH50313.1 hypothetical protein CAL7102_04611 [Dulcicalothrix desertica PCC 7102]